MNLRLRKSLNMTFVRYQYFALLTCSIFLYFISNQFFYQLVDPNPNSSYAMKLKNKSCVDIHSNHTILSSNYSPSTTIRNKIENGGKGIVNILKIMKKDKIRKKQSGVSKEGKNNKKDNVTVNVSYSKSIVTKIVKVKDTGTRNNSISKNGQEKVSSRPPPVSSSTPASSSTFPTTTTMRTSSTTGSSSTKLINLNESVERTTGRDWYTLFKDTANKVYQLFSPDYLSDYRKWAMRKERELLAEEMKGYIFSQPNKTLSDFVMEKGGQPIRNVIFTTWRSGSTFLGEIMSSHPGTFYHYEPLLHFGQVQVREGPLANEALRVVRSLLNCDYHNLTDYMTYGKRQHWLFNHNTRVWNFCMTNRQVCWNWKWQENMCKMFPFQALKTVRMRLRLARSLLQDEKLNIKLLHLVRDPRGTVQSRFHRDWCPNHPDCDDPAILCSDLVQDFEEAKKLRIEYPDRFMVVRYEDISTSIHKAIKKIFKFFRLQLHPKVKMFLDEHTKENVGGVSSTYRDSKTAPFHWLKDMAHNFSTIVKIQNSCKKAMNVWGYNYLHSEKQLTNFKSLRNPPWSDMIIS